MSLLSIKEEYPLIISVTWVGSMVGNFTIRQRDYYRVSKSKIMYENVMDIEYQKIK